MSKAAKSVFSEVEAFRQAGLWQGGFLDCNPLVPLSWSSYTSNGFVSVYHAVYMAAIKPYLPVGGVALEIGPGHGAWTKALIAAGASKVIALDVQSRDFNGIDDWLGDDATKLEYHEVGDLSCNEVADRSIDFFWSFGAFVHMSSDVQREYVRSLFRKMKKGAHGFVQYADIDVWNRSVTAPELQVHHLLANVLGGEEGEAVRRILDTSEKIRPREQVADAVKSWDVVAPGRYYYTGEAEMRAIVEGAKFEVHESNWMPNLRDPIIHFSKS